MSNSQNIFRVLVIEPVGVSCIGIQHGFGIAPEYVLFQPVIRCNCATAAWAIEILTAIVFGLWVLASAR